MLEAMKKSLQSVMNVLSRALQQTALPTLKNGSGLGTANISLLLEMTVCEKQRCILHYIC